MTGRKPTAESALEIKLYTKGTTTMNKNKKYRLAEKADPEIGLYRIIALKDFGDVHKGDVGGWMESEEV